MERRFLVLSVALGAMFVGLMSGEARVRIGFGIYFKILPSAHDYVDVKVDQRFPDAVPVRGYWYWSDHARRYVWVERHRGPRYSQPVYRERKLRYVPHVVAKRRWRKHERPGEGKHGRYHNRIDN